MSRLFFIFSKNYVRVRCFEHLFVNDNVNNLKRNKTPSMWRLRRRTTRVAALFFISTRAQDLLLLTTMPITQYIAAVAIAGTTATFRTNAQAPSLFLSLFRLISSTNKRSNVKKKA